MIKENLKLVIKKFYESAISDLMERQPLFDFSILHAPFNTVITIVGLRQAGKTFFQIIKELLKSGLVSLIFCILILRMNEFYPSEDRTFSLFRMLVLNHMKKRQNLLSFLTNFRM